MENPIVKIKSFAGEGDGRAMSNIGFGFTQENGNLVLQTNFKQVKSFDVGDTGFTGIAGKFSVAYLKTVHNSLSYSMLLDPNGIYIKKGSLSTPLTEGVVCTSSAGRTNLTELASGDLIYTTNGTGTTVALAKLVRGKAMSGSGATALVDSAGRDFTDGKYGIAVDDYVYNLNDQEGFQITSITTTNSANDTLNFAAGTNAWAENDEFIVVNPDYVADIETTEVSGQPGDSVLPRQIIPFDLDWLIGNGNYLSILNEDEETLTAEYKQLPLNHYFVAADVNNGYLVVISSYGGRYYSLVWDGFSDGWNNIKPIEGGAVNAIKAYKAGFVYMLNGKLYFTDGWTDIVLSVSGNESEVPSSYLLYPEYFDSLMVANEIVYIANGVFNYNRVVPGLYYFSPYYGWGVLPVLYDDAERYGPSRDYETVYYNPNQNRVEVYGSICGNYLSPNGAVSDDNMSKSYLIEVQFDVNTPVNAIGLNVAAGFDYVTGAYSIGKNVKIGVNAGDGSRIVKRYVDITSYTTSTITVNGTLTSGEIGDEILMIDDESSGERTFITNISGKGTATEVWTVSPALSEAGSGTGQAFLFNLASCGIKEVEIDEVAEELVFPTTRGILSDKVVIEIVVYGVENPSSVAILGLNIY